MNSYVRLIHEYIDRNLEGYLEDVLFKELAINADLRQEFSEQMRLHGIAQRDMALIMPPKQAATELFAKLGIDLSLQPATVTSGAIVSHSAFLPLLTKYFPYALVAMLSCLLTLSATYYPSLHTPVPVVASFKSVPQKQPQTPLSALRQTTVFSPRRPISPHHTTPVVPKTSVPSVETNASERDASYALSPISPLPVKRSNRQPEEQWHGELSRANLSEYILSDGNSDFPILLQLRRAGGRTVSSPAATDGASLTDMPLDVLYELSPGQYLGVEFAREHFLQEYQQVIDGEQMSISRTSLLPCFGLVYRQEVQSLSPINSLTPFAQGFVGGTPEGLLGRLMLGIQYEPEQRIALTAGVEGSILPYSVQKHWYTTQKLGFVYGISVKF